VLIKHYSLLLFLRFLPVIVIYQLCWLLFTIKKGQFRAYCQGMGDVLHGFSKMRQKYKSICQYDRLTRAEFAVHLKAAEKAVVDSIMCRRSEQGKKNGLLRVYQIVFVCAAENYSTVKR
jgi:hypothetical protein